MVSCQQVELHIPGAYNLTLHLPIIVGTVPYRRASTFNFTDSHFYRETQAPFNMLTFLSVPNPPPYRETITPPPPFEGNKTDDLFEHVGLQAIMEHHTT